MKPEIIEYTAKLLADAVLGNPVKPLPDNIELGEFINFCVFHKLDNIVYLSISDRLPKSAAEFLRKRYMRSINLQTRQQYYVDAVSEKLNENGIDFLLLKGSELSKLYPFEDMRISSDTDIYVGKKNAGKVKDIMLELGFEVQDYNDADDDHDTYMIDKTVFFEMHRILIQGRYSWRDECNRITDRLEPYESCRKRMSYEDFYLYNLAHTAKHMKLSGIGMRAFLDMWLISEKYGDKIDQAILSERLKKSGLDKFDENVKKLCNYWFLGQSPDEFTAAMSLYVAESGWIGTYEQHASTVLAENAAGNNSKFIAKVRKCLGIVFAPYDEMKHRYPILEKHRYLLPFCGIHRGIKALLFRRGLIEKVTEDIENGDPEKGKAILALKKEMGL